MRYQDLKIRDTLRLVLMGLAMEAASLALAHWHARLPGGLLRRYEAWVWALGLMGLFAWGMALVYLFTSPAQNARFIAGRTPPGFDTNLLDSADPDYRTTTLRYWLHRPRSR